MPVVCLRSIDMHHVPVRREPAGDPGSHPDQALHPRTRRQADHHLLRDRGLFQSLHAPVFGRCRTNLFRSGAEGKFAQHVEIALAEEVRQRLLYLFRGVHLALAQAIAQLVDGDVDVDDLVRPPQEAVGDGFTNLRAGRARDRIVQRLQMLNVHRRHDVDAGVQQLEHVFIALAVA